MKKLSFAMLIMVVGWAMFYMGCMDREPAPVCPVPLEVAKDDVMIGGFDGIDMLVVVDNSSSMEAEQAILATSFFPLVNSLVNPLPGWPYPAADNVRIGIVSTDLGFYWGGNPYKKGDGIPKDEMFSCKAAGDEGRFKTNYLSNKVAIEQDKIPCDASKKQCPTGWDCININNDIGVCHDNTGDGTNQQCPASPNDLGMDWTETTPASPKNDIAFTAACLSNLGTNGCGFEQQLESAVVALKRGDQNDFIRDEKLLVVLIVSDEEDCSFETNGIFKSDEMKAQTPSKYNVACNVEHNLKHLYKIDHFKNAFKEAKGVDNAVVFASIVGVPVGKDSPCQGKGSEIGTCLDAPDMQFKERIAPNTNGDDTTYGTYVCERGEVTQAYPGRRYVELAQSYGSMSYVYSICNEDWSPAMKEIAALIASQMNGTCYEKSLDYDMVHKKAKCDVLVEYENAKKCPDEYNDTDPTQKQTTVGDTKQTNVYCTMPQLPAGKVCSSITDLSAIKTKFGWYYCENTDQESFEEACKDGIDNDGNGQTDCDDDKCKTCKEACQGDGSECTGLCNYQVSFTPSAEVMAKGHSISVQCITQYAFADPNCQEDTKETCNNNIDDDGNGVFDCTTITVEESKEHAHIADPKCCPIKNVKDKCEEVNDGFSICKDGRDSDACKEAARIAGCSF